MSCAVARYKQKINGALVCKRKVKSYMNIALLAHDSKKELLSQFCMAYASILSSHNLYAPTTTGKMITNATGLPVTLFLPCASGGWEQIASRIALNEMDLVIFFCDPSGRAHTDDIEKISRTCDNNGIAYASNIATAEVLIQGLKYGEFYWRNIFR